MATQRPRGSGQPPRGQQPPAPKILIPEGVSEFYANSLQIGTSAFDFMLFFGSIMLPATLGPTAQRVQGQIRVDAVVRMSPQHAKASLRALQTTLEGWEREFGEIRIPELPEEGGHENQ